uniref:Uncharacterized protein n=1 Tax=Arundo donax TaxID=35708 RepID=A0A0A9F549_ARUDO
MQCFSGWMQGSDSGDDIAEQFLPVVASASTRRF